MENIKMPISPILDGNSFAINGDIISTTGSGGFPPDTNKGLDVEDNKLAVKADNDTIKFDANGKIKVGENVVEWKEYPAQTLVNEKLILPSGYTAIEKHNGIYYAPNSSGSYVAYCTDGHGTTWNNTALEIGASSAPNLGRETLTKITLDDGKTYLMAPVNGLNAAISGLRSILYSIGELTNTGVVNKGWMQWAYVWGSTGTWVNNMPAYINPSTKEITFLINSSISSSSANSRYLEYFKVGGVSSIHTSRSSSDNSGARIGEKSVGGSGQWYASFTHIANLWGYEFYIDQITSGGSYSGKLTRRNSGNTATAAYDILPSTTSNIGCAYKDKLYLFNSTSSSTMRVVSQDMTYTDQVMPYTGIVKAAYGDADNFYLCYSDGQIWRYNGTTWDKLHDADNATIFSKVGVFDDGEIYGINTTTKKLWTLGTAKIHRIEQNNIDVTTDFITWLRWELNKNIY